MRVVVLAAALALLPLYAQAQTEVVKRRGSWVAECTANEVREQASCWLRHKESRAVNINFSQNESGRWLTPFLIDKTAGAPETWRGMYRVDQNPGKQIPIGVVDVNSMISEMKVGKTLRIETWPWKADEAKVEVLSLGGFSAAYCDMLDWAQSRGFSFGALESPYADKRAITNWVRCP